MNARNGVGVGVIGHGAIGSVVAAALARGEVPSARLVGVTARRKIADPPAPQLGLDALVATADLVVEAAGHDVVRDHVVDILDRGVDVILVSPGALADDELAAAIVAAGPGSAMICSGAIGGLDILRAAQATVGLDSVVLTTTKRPRVLVQPWMDEELAARLHAGDERVIVFEGSAREAAPRFPRSINVAATLALALGSWGVVGVRVIADPDATLTRHVIEANGRAGDYRIEVANEPSPLNPATSGVVPYAVLRTISDYCLGPLTLR